MKKISKLLVMTLVLLAVVTMSLTVNAASKDILVEYVRSAHNVNGMLIELTNSQKNAITDYIATLDDATAASIHADLVSMENTLKNTGATNSSQVSASVKTEILNQAKATAQKAGLTLTVNTGSKSFTLQKANGETLASGSYKTLVANPGTASGGNGSQAAAATGSKLLYTGSNYIVAGSVVLAIVAVAVIVKKRA